MKRVKLEVEKRKILGRKVKKLRREGFLPATIYGKKINSVSVQVPLKEFESVHHQVGETGVVDLSLKGEEKSRPVLIKNIQADSVTGQPLHVDFHQVDLREKITATVPLVIVGEAAAVKDKKGLLLTTLSEVEVEALPTDLPENIEVDVSGLSEVDQEVKVADLKIPAQVALLTDAGLVVCKIGPLVTKEMEEEIKKEEAAAAAAAEVAVEEVPAGEAPAGGEAPTEATKAGEEQPPTPQ